MKERAKKIEKKIISFIAQKVYVFKYDGNSITFEVHIMIRVQKGFQGKVLSASKKPIQKIISIRWPG